jgi:hypothetical protein
MTIKLEYLYGRLIQAKNVKAGSRAGGKGNKKYRYIKVFGQEITEGRLAWFYMKGELPEGRVKYKNGDCTDCRFENLTTFQKISGDFDHKTYSGRMLYNKFYRKKKLKKLKKLGILKSTTIFH